LSIGKPSFGRAGVQGQTNEECLADSEETNQLRLKTERAEVFRLDPQAATAELALA